MDYTEYARLFKALSDPKRLKIVHMLAGGELCACKILEEFHITQPTLSHDMKLLTDAGLVIPRREGKWTHYSLNKTRVGEICRAAEGLMIPEAATAAPSRTIFAVLGLPHSAASFSAGTGITVIS